MTSLKNHNFSKTPEVFPIFLRQFHVLRLTLEAGRRRKANATLRDGPGSVAAVLRLLAWPSKVGEITGEFIPCVHYWLVVSTPLKNREFNGI